LRDSKDGVEINSPSVKFRIILNSWIIGQRTLLLQNWVYFVPTFFQLSSQHFCFKVQLIDSVEVKTLLLFTF